MGSLAFAAGGALGGLGQGLADIGKQSLVAQREEALTRLREEFSNESQAKGFAHEEASQQKQMAFSHSERLEQQDVAAKAAGAQREFLTDQQRELLQARKEMNAATNASRVEVGAGHDAARAASDAKKPGPKLWEPTVHTYNAMVPDPNDPTGKTLIAGQKSTTTYKNTKTGWQLVKLGDGRLAQFNGDISNIPSASSIARAPAAKEELLIQNPDKAQDFLNKYHYLPDKWWQAQSFHDQDVANGGPGLQGPVANQPQRNAQSGPTFMDDYQKNHPVPGAPQSGGMLGKAKTSNMASPSNQPQAGGGGGSSDTEVETDNKADDERADAEDAARQQQQDAQDDEQLARNRGDYAPPMEPGQ